MKRLWLVVGIALVGCDEPLVLGRTKQSRPQEPLSPSQPQPRIEADRPAPPSQPLLPSQPPPEVAKPAPATPRPIEVLEVDSSPTNIAIANGTLVWTDTAGALWTMPARGGARPKQLSNQHMPGQPMYGNLVAVGSVVVATKQNALAKVTLPDGPIEVIATPSEDWLIELETDGTAVYSNFMDSAEVFKLTLDGTKTKLTDFKRASLAVHGDTVYAVGYGSGTIIAMKDGKRRTIASGLRHPTGFAVDDQAAYVWTEGDRALRRIDLKTGKTTFLEKQGLENTDELVLDGDWVYLYTWFGPGKSKFLRVAKDGSGTQVLADGLGAPNSIAVDADAVYVSLQDADRILRFDKRAITPL